MLNLKLRISPGGATNLDIPETQGVAANIYANTGEGKSIRDITVPVGSESRSFQLPAGDYTIECLLPSGEILTEDVLLSDEDRDIVLYSERSTNESMTRQKFAASGPNQQVYRPLVFQDIPLSLEIKQRLDNKEIEAELTRKEVQVYGAFANPFWRDRLVSNLDQFTVQRNAIETLVFDYLFDTTQMDRFRGNQLWTLIAQLTTGEATLESLRLLEDCETAVRTGHDLITKINREEDSNDRISLFRLKSGTRDSERLRRVVVWTPNGIELFVLPDVWQLARSGDGVPIEVTVDRSESTRRFRASVVPDDPRMLSVLAYLSAGALPTAAQLTRSYVAADVGVEAPAAEDLLWEKISNPLAAAIGGYALLTTARDRDRTRWPQWISNLANVAGWLPDAHVLNGWLQLMDGKSEDAASSFIKAFGTGVPVFTPILRMLYDGLRMAAAKSDSLKEPCELVRRTCTAVNPTLSFTVFQLGSNTAQPSERR